MADSAESRCDHPWHLLEYMRGHEGGRGECYPVLFNGWKSTYS
jgi:hypothetical protein